MTQKPREEDELPSGTPRVKARLRSLEASALNAVIIQTPPPPTHHVNQAPGNTEQNIHIGMSSHVYFSIDDPLDAFTTVSDSVPTLSAP